jgi:hypothetical protein
MNKENRYPRRRQWPDVELPTPRVSYWRYELIAGGWLVPQLGTLKLAPPPAELHLREMREVDAGDPEALRQLCEEVGEVVDYGTPWSGVVGRRKLPEVAMAHAIAQADNIGDQLGLPEADWDSRPAEAVHAREVGLRVASVRLLVEHTRLYLAGDRVAPVWQRVGAFDEDPFWTKHDEQLASALGERPLADESPEVVGWARFAGYLNDGLEEFSPRLLAFNIESEPDFGDVVTAYGAACALIFNDLRDGNPYRVCADETCGRLFRRQLGRSKGVNKPRSSGVEFCTWAHARNQSRRERRRAERAAAGEES